VAVGAQEDLARPGVPLLGQRDVADALVALGADVVEVWQPLLADELPENGCPPVRVKLLSERMRGE